MKYFFYFIILICIVHGLVIHGSPLLKVRSNNLMERGCTPGGKYHDCSRDDACKYDDDCAGDMECNENGYCEPTYDPGPPCC
ncbi:hypothetical protein F8M41_010102 [Gigaspora margarita]|uniref:Uncharacterized protein n=1 Tax=Gigaspora margarita TaxID=4874 RepID=A0A8H4EQE8_GIGMA|nr:hypothetical protein F8M41_010102 [Gigaspora margarita]